MAQQRKNNIIFKRRRQLKIERNPRAEAECLYPNYDMTVWLRSCVKETMEPVEGLVTGAIPPWLEGCLLRNGPGSLKVGDMEFDHLFDCSALLHRFNIKNGIVTYQNRFLQSETYKKNLAAQRIVVTEFGTSSVPDPCQSIFQRVAAVFDRFGCKTDNAVVSIYPFGDEYFAMTETPITHMIDPEDLTTMERVNLGASYGIVNHTAHPHVMMDKTVYNLGLAVYKTGPRYCILEFSPGTDKNKSMLNTGRIVAKVPVRWKFHPGYMHTFGITDNYYVIVEQPLSVSVPSIFKNCIRNRPFVEALKWYEEAETIIHLVSRDSGKIYRSYIADAFFYLHIINQYEEEDHLVIDICCYQDPSVINCMYIESLKVVQQNPDYSNMSRCRPLRFVLPLKPDIHSGLNDKGNLQNLNLLKKTQSEAFWMNDKIFVKPELLCDLGCELPRINYERCLGKKYRYFYVTSSDVENPATLNKVDVETKTRKTWYEANVYPSEGVFVPTPGATEEDEGIVLSALVWGGERSNETGLLILDASTWTEIGRVTFTTDGPVPKCLHGWFVNNFKK